MCIMRIPKYLYYYSSVCNPCSDTTYNIVVINYPINFLNQLPLFDYSGHVKAKNVNYSIFGGFYVEVSPLNDHII